MDNTPTQIDNSIEDTNFTVIESEGTLAYSYYGMSYEYKECELEPIDEYQLEIQKEQAIHARNPKKVLTPYIKNKIALRALKTSIRPRWFSRKKTNRND